MLFTFIQSKKIMLFLLIAFLSIFSVSCTSNSSYSGSEEIPEDILYIKTSESTIKYLRHEYIEDFHYRDVLAIYLEYTNNLSHENNFASSFHFEAYQNERLLRESSYDLEGVDDNYTKRIRHGKTETICILYNLYDGSDVDLKLHSVASDGIYEDSMILSIE